MPREEQRAVQLLWVDVDDKEITFANQILAQHIGSEFVISFGQVTPPPLLGDEDEKSELLAQIEFVPIRTVARIGLTAQRMAEFVKVMQQNLSAYEQQKGIDRR